MSRVMSNSIELDSVTTSPPVRLVSQSQASAAPPSFHQGSFSAMESLYDQLHTDEDVMHTVSASVVKVPKTVTRERIIENHIYHEEIVHVPTKVVKEQIVEVPVYITKQRVKKVPKIVEKEIVVEVPEVEYREVPIHKEIKVPQVKEEFVTVEVEVPSYVDVPTIVFNDVQKVVEVERLVPLPCHMTTVREYTAPRIRTTHKTVEVPVYVPKYVETLQMEYLPEGLGEDAVTMIRQVC
ncbi:MAG: hypothetical protein KVP17_000946 [Porospora cf. gigantea B]|uniref:uncharacterized protein n=1 Tax=Porospora cf. gigantea B TaxID=2853592 RepID=UPI003571E66B|nr:MAG: hypothetical protein KVP17_000946 [Porospora cf. gigantea B]